MLNKKTCMHVRKSTCKKQECLMQNSNPGPYGYELICKTLALNKHSWIHNACGYIIIKISLFTLKPQDIKNKP